MRLVIPVAMLALVCVWRPDSAAQAQAAEQSNEALRAEIANLREQVARNRKAIEKLDTSGGIAIASPTSSAARRADFTSDGSGRGSGAPGAANAPPPVQSNASTALNVIRDREDRDLARQRSQLLDEYLRAQILKK